MKNQNLNLNEKAISVLQNNNSEELTTGEKENRFYQHEEAMAKHSVAKSKFETVKVGIVAFIVALVFIAFITVIILTVVRPSVLQENSISKVETLISQGRFDDARDEVKKLDMKASGPLQMIQFKLEINRELNRIERKEKEWMLEKGITVGRSSKSFLSLNYSEAQNELKKVGFNKKNIKPIPIVDSSWKYRKTELGTVIDISINGDKSFSAKDKFAIDSVIEIYYLDSHN